MNSKGHLSPGNNFKSKKRTVDWFPRDVLNNFETKSSSHKDYWNKQEKITYNINEYGFRSDDLFEKEYRDSITFLGCSNTFGIGMNKEKTWPSLLANEMNLKEINFGIPAGSLDSAFRVYNEWQPIIKSKLTCVMIPPGRRIEIVRNSVWLPIGSWSSKRFSSEELVDLLDETYCDVNSQRNLAAIKYIAQETDSQLIIVNYHDVPWDPEEMPARDGSHPGDLWHKRAMQIFRDKIRNL